MPEKNETIFFIDDDLVERLMRGDTTAADPSKKKRPAEATALSTAVKLASDGKLDDAVKELERALGQGENAIEVHTGLGHLRFEQQKWDEAAAAYSKVIELDPKNRTAHYNLGLVRERQGKFAEAAQSFEAALAVDPKRWQARVGLGLCQLQLGKAEDALESFQASLKESPNQDRALFGKAVALHQLGKLDEAGRSLSKTASRQRQLGRTSGQPDRPFQRPQGRQQGEGVRRTPAESSSRNRRRPWKDSPQSRFRAAITVPPCSIVRSWSKRPPIPMKDGSTWASLIRKPDAWNRPATPIAKQPACVPTLPKPAANLGVILQERGDLAGARNAYTKVLAQQPDLPGALVEPGADRRTRRKIGRRGKII